MKRTVENPLKEIMTTREMLECNRRQASSFVFFRMGDWSFKGSTATLVCDYSGLSLGSWVCIESGSDDAKWKIR